MRVAVFGALGRMGQTASEAIDEDAELELVAGLEYQDPFTKALDAKSDVIVDFTNAESARKTLTSAGEAGIHAVVGTTGLTENDIKKLNLVFTKSACLIVPNFAIGAVLMMKFAESAAPYFESAEIIEMHHEKKVDAPSGTALQTAKRMAEASKDWADDPTKKETLSGSRGAKGPGGIPIHSVRLKGMVASQEVQLGTTGQSLTIRHDTYDRTAFMPGLILAIKKINTLPVGVTVGLEAVL